MSPSHRPAGPVEMVILGIPDATAGPALAASISDIVGTGAARVLDALWILKDENGEITVIDLDDEGTSGLFGFETWVPGLFGIQDVTEIAAELPLGTAAAVIVWENTWAAGISQVVQEAGGFALAHERIPAGAIDDLLDMLDELETTDDQ